MHNLKFHRLFCEATCKWISDFRGNQYVREGLGSVPNLLCSVQFPGITMTSSTYCVPYSFRGSPWRHQSHHALRFRWAVWRAGSTRLGGESARSATGCHRYCAGARLLPLSCWYLVPVWLPSGCSGFLPPGGRTIVKGLLHRQQHRHRWPTGCIPFLSAEISKYKLCHFTSFKSIGIDVRTRCGLSVKV